MSVLQSSEDAALDKESNKGSAQSESVDLPTAFSLAKFIPLLQERIYVINPFTRTFLVSWVTLLDTIPDLELVAYLPAFLGGLFKFLSDPNRDVHVATQGALERFLNEIKKIARIKRGIEESRRGQSDSKPKQSNSSDSGSVRSDRSTLNEKSDIADGDNDAQDGQLDGDWVPGQDVQVDHSKILEILVAFLDSSSGGRSIMPMAYMLVTDTQCRGGNPAYGLTLDRQLLRDLSGGYPRFRSTAAFSGPSCNGQRRRRREAGCKPGQQLSDGAHCLSTRRKCTRPGRKSANGTFTDSYQYAEGSR